MVLDCFLQLKFETSNSKKFQRKISFFPRITLWICKKINDETFNGLYITWFSYPWFCYWITNILEITIDRYELSYDDKLKFIDMLKELQHHENGFCRMHNVYVHLISTYGAMMAILKLNIKETYDIVIFQKWKISYWEWKIIIVNIKKKPSYVDKNGVF